MYEFIKRIIDIIFSICVLIFSLPLILIIAILIKIDNWGPVFYQQQMIGKDGKQFNIFKFRTMVYGDDVLHERYLKQIFDRELGPEKGGRLLKLKADPRVTRIGRFLRKYSLDELPLFINVLKGDMSIIGPRPALPYMVEHYEDWQRERLKIKPGISGPWLFRNSFMDYEDMIKMDIVYARQKSLWLDFKIMIRTITTLLSSDLRRI